MCQIIFLLSLHWHLSALVNCRQELCQVARHCFHTLKGGGGSETPFKLEASQSSTKPRPRSGLCERVQKGQLAGQEAGPQCCATLPARSREPPLGLPTPSPHMAGVPSSSSARGQLLSRLLYHAHRWRDSVQRGRVPLKHLTLLLSKAREHIVHLSQHVHSVPQGSYMAAPSSVLR